MSKKFDLELISKVANNLTVGIGIFHVSDLSDNKSIRYVFMNKVLLFEMRKEKEEVLGKKIIEIAPEAYEHEGGLMVIDTYMKIANEGGFINLGLVEYSNHMVAGTYECSVHGIMKNYVYVQLRNVTELEKAKIELEKANKELKQFTYIASHDLQEPLNSIISFSRLLESSKYNLDEIGKKSIEIIINSSYRMKDFIIALLEYSSIGKEKKKKKIDVDQLIENLKIDLNNLIVQKEVKINYIGNPLTIIAFETDLIKLFQNLVVNGIKYNKNKKPTIIINATEKFGQYEFSINDNGIGIAKEDCDQIFKVFQRLHNRDQFSGTGIGLAHCKKIIELHDGKIWLTSELGKGTTFYFTISK